MIGSFLKLNFLIIDEFSVQIMSISSTQSNNDVLLGLIAELTQQRDAARLEANYYRKQLGITETIPVELHSIPMTSESSETADSVGLITEKEVRKLEKKEAKRAKKEAKRVEKEAEKEAKKEAKKEAQKEAKKDEQTEKQKIKDALAAAGVKKPSAFAPYQKWLKEHFSDVYKRSNPHATNAEMRNDAKNAWASMSDDAKAPWQIEYKNALKEYQTKRETICANISRNNN